MQHIKYFRAYSERPIAAGSVRSDDRQDDTEPNTSAAGTVPDLRSVKKPGDGSGGVWG